MEFNIILIHFSSDIETSRILLIFFGIALCLLQTEAVLKLYLFSFILKILNGILLHREAADTANNRRYYKHLE